MGVNWTYTDSMSERVKLETVVLRLLLLRDRHLFIQPTRRRQSHQIQLEVSEKV